MKCAWDTTRDHNLLTILEIVVSTDRVPFFLFFGRRGTLVAVRNRRAFALNVQIVRPTRCGDEITRWTVVRNLLKFVTAAGRIDRLYISVSFSSGAGENVRVGLALRDFVSVPVRVAQVCRFYIGVRRGSSAGIFRANVTKMCTRPVV